MSAPTNGTAATAIDLTSSVPYAAVIDTTGASTDPEVLISGSTAADRAVWWSYRNNDAVFYKLVEISSIGVDAGSGYPITNYYSITSVWRGSPGSLTQAFERHDAWVDTGSPGDDRGNYLSVPVAPGETIYILISDNDSNLGGSLSLSVEATRLQRGTLIASNVSASDTDRGQWLTAFASDGSATGRDAPIHNGGTLTGIAQHPTTREVLAYNAGSNFPLVRLSPTLGLIERCATIWTSLTPTFVGSNFQWGAQGLAIDPTTGDILLLWAGSNVGGSNIGHHELQRRDATTWALLEQWSDFIPATLLGTAGINVMPGQVSPDGTSYYLTTQGSTGTGQNKVFKLDLGSGVVTTFATVGTWSGGVNPTGNFCQWQPVVLSDGRVVTAWTHMTTGTADQLHVVVHNSGGSLVIDFDLTTDVGTGLAIRTGPAVTLDESEIWIEYQSHGGGAFPNWLDRFTLATGANAHHVEALTDTDGVDIRFRDLLVLATLGGLCYGGGEVAIQADPPDGTPFSGRQLNPRAMLQLNFDDQTRYYSNDALNTPTRRHRGSVIQFGTITRQLSDRTSPYKVADCQVDVDDSDRHLSILEATAASEHWQNREAKVTVQNLDSLALDETPHTLGRFIWRKHLSSGLQRTIGLTDVLGSEFSDFNLERTLPTRQVKDDFPGAPEASLERYVPIAIGVFPDRSGAALDASAVSGVTVAPLARAPAPTNFTLTPTAGGNFQAGNDAFYLLGAIVGGVMSDLAGPVSFTTDDTNKSAQLNWDAYPGADALVLFSAVKSHFLQFARVFLAAGDTSYLDTYVMPNQDPEWRYPNSPWHLDYRITVTWYVEALLSDGTYSTPGVSAPLVISPITREYETYNTQVAWSAHPDAVGYRATRFVSLYSFGGGRFDLQYNLPASQLSLLDVGNSTYDIPPGWTGDAAGIVRPVFGTRSTIAAIPLIPIGQITDNGITYNAGLLCGHAIRDIDSIAYSIPPATDDTSGKQQFVAVADAEWGVEWFAPTKTGWPLAQNYYEINGRWYTVVLKLHDPWPDKVLVNCCAMEDVGDSTGNTIDGAARQLFQLLQQFWLPPSEEAWTNGAWLTPRTFTDGTPIVNTQCIAELERIETNRIGRYYRGQLFLDEPITLRTFLERFFISFGMRFGQNQHGQVIAVHLDDFADLTSAVHLTDVRDLVAETSIDRALAQMENRIVYDYGYRPTIEGQFVRQAQVLQDATAIGSESTGSPAMATGNRGRIAQGDRRQMFYVDDPVTAVDVVARDLAFGKYPPRYCVITCTLHAVLVTLGSIVTVTDFEGIGATGWTNRPLWVLGIETTLGDQQTDPTVRLTCVDVLRVLNGVGEWALDTVANWNVATDDEQAANLYWADASDQMSDGSLGKVWG